MRDAGDDDVGGVIGIRDCESGQLFLKTITKLFLSPSFPPSYSRNTAHIIVTSLPHRMTISSPPAAHAVQ
jgi:hypothetical protein